MVLGVAGASFAVALPLASRWYPPQYQGIALGIAGAGNSGHGLRRAVRTRPRLAFGWTNVVGMAAIPLTIALLVYILWPRTRPIRRPPRACRSILPVLRIGDAWWFMFFYSVTFGGFIGLASSLTIYFNAEYGLSAVTAGYFTAAASSPVRWCGRSAAPWPIGSAASARSRSCTSLRPPRLWSRASAFRGLDGACLLLAGMLALGMGNGAVFQLVPQRFRAEIGVMTGLVGMTGGVGGFYLASSLGYSKQSTGSYQVGLLIFAVLAMIALVGLTSIKGRWRTTWGAVGMSAARI